LARSSMPVRRTPPLSLIKPVRYESERVIVIDQTRLPHEFIERELTSTEQIAEAIETMVVRGAPLLGIVAAYGVAMAAYRDSRPQHLHSVIRRFAATRPTARNLHAALERMQRVVDSEPNELVQALAAEAHHIHKEDLQASAAIAALAPAVFTEPAWVVTICNTGALATGGGGTALALLVAGFQQGAVDGVYVCETRPLFQGARLTAWELERAGVPFRVLPDSAAASLVTAGNACAVAVGADRIARNGDTANKVGTQMLAALAQQSRVPFHVVAPRTTFDSETPTGKQIVIEQRSENEVRTAGGAPVIPADYPVYNPSFDITESHLITNYVTDIGVFAPQELEASGIWS
jgi:methylthioribose-1-phosphate isomerase